MRKFALIILLVTISGNIFSQVSGYMGKRMAVDLSLRLDPVLDEALEHFGVGYTGSFGYVTGNQTLLNGSFSRSVRKKRELTQYGIDIHLLRSSYISPIGKAWIIGFGRLDEKRINEILDPAITETRTEESQSIYTRFGHEYRTILKGSNFYFVTQVNFEYYIHTGGDQKFSETLFNGKLGLGVLL